MKKPSQETTPSPPSAAPTSLSLISLPRAVSRTEIITEGRAGAQCSVLAASGNDAISIHASPASDHSLLASSTGFHHPIKNRATSRYVVIFGKASTHTEIIYSILVGSARVSEEGLAVLALQPCSPSHLTSSTGHC